MNFVVEKNDPKHNQDVALLVQLSRQSGNIDTNRMRERFIEKMREKFARKTWEEKAISEKNQ